MKMARASKADLDAALDVSNIIEQLEQGYMPSTDDADDVERFDSDDREQCKRALGAILDAAAKGSLFRVTFGMTVVLDPRNELLDPAADTLELHPKLVAARDRAASANETTAARTTFVQELRARGADVEPVGSGDERLCLVGSMLVDDILAAARAAARAGGA